MAKGDHLVAQHLGFTHHGIDLGDGTVIEYGGKGTGRMSVTTLSPDETIRLAWARLREQDYHLFDNNCEHLAYWCKTGLHWSPQADKLKNALKVRAAMFAVAVIADAV